ncbi:MAG: hypothetical protein ACI97A_001021 [Planctomycetota bacterium]|jgi:hypothetical protein
MCPYFDRSFRYEHREIPQVKGFCKGFSDEGLLRIYLGRSMAISFVEISLGSSIALDTEEILMSGRRGERSNSRKQSEGLCKRAFPA